MHPTPSLLTEDRAKRSTAGMLVNPRRVIRMTLEGEIGSGKSSLFLMVAQKLVKMGHQVIVRSSPAMPYLVRHFEECKNLDMEKMLTVGTPENVEPWRVVLHEKADPKVGENGCFAIAVKSCARCGGNHSDVTFVKLTQPCELFTHWAPCPANAEPIMMLVTEVQDSLLMGNGAGI